MFSIRDDCARIVSFLRNGKDCRLSCLNVSFEMSVVIWPAWISNSVRYEKDLMAATVSNNRVRPSRRDRVSRFRMPEIISFNRLLASPRRLRWRRSLQCECTRSRYSHKTVETLASCRWKPRSMSRRTSWEDKLNGSKKALVLWIDMWAVIRLGRCGPSE